MRFLLIDQSSITAVILCGGAGSRLDGRDKPLIQLGDRRIVEWIRDGLRPQVATIVLSCSRNVALYETFGHDVVVDEETGRGPLAGLNAALQHVQTDWTLTTPGDTPFISSSLVERLSPAAERDGIAVPEVNAVRQNLCLLMNSDRRTELMNYYETGGRAVKYWLDAIECDSVKLDELQDSFYNVNTHEELLQAESVCENFRH